MSIPERTRTGAEQTAALVADGMTFTQASKQVAALHGVGPQTVRNWVHKTGTKVRSQQQPHSIDFNAERRAEAGNRLASVIEGRIGQLEKALTDGTEVDSRQIRELAIAFGVMTDKRRLEDGLVTDRTETSVPAREIIEGKIDELAERRSKRDG